MKLDDPFYAHFQVILGLNQNIFTGCNVQKPHYFPIIFPMLVVAALFDVFGLLAKTPHFQLKWHSVEHKGPTLPLN